MGDGLWKKGLVPDAPVGIEREKEHTEEDPEMSRKHYLS